jgi:hypothetical protein
MRLVGPVVQMERIRSAYNILVKKSKKKREYLGDQDV